MVVFRSKEDNARDKLPFHRFQERICAFHAMIQMIANLTELEPRTLGKLQASLHRLVRLFSPRTKMNLALIFENEQEQDIDQIISDAQTYEDNQGMKGIPDDAPVQLRPWLQIVHSEEEILQWDKVYERVRRNTVRKRKQARIRYLLTSLNELSSSLFAAISVAERQVAILHDLHSLFLTSSRTKTKDREKEYPLLQNLLQKNISPIPTVSGSLEQTWQNTLDTIDEVARERKSFIKRINVLVQNMEVRREIV